MQQRHASGRPRVSPAVQLKVIGNKVKVWVWNYQSGRWSWSACNCSTAIDPDRRRRRKNCASDRWNPTSYWSARRTEQDRSIPANWVRSNLRTRDRSPFLRQQWDRPWECWDGRRWALETGVGSFGVGSHKCNEVFDNTTPTLPYDPSRVGQHP